jgi:hypothetical protein
MVETSPLFDGTEGLVFAQWRFRAMVAGLF